MELSYIYRPGKEVILFLHGLGLNKESALELFFSPALQKYGLLAPDLPGHGKSARLGIDSSYTFESIAKQIVIFLNDLNLTECHLLVHSISSYLIPYLLGSRIKVKSIMMLEGNVSSEDAEWSKLMATMTEDELVAYTLKLKKTAKFVFKSQLLNQHSPMHIAAYASGFSDVDPRALKDMSLDASNLLDSELLIETLKSREHQCIYFRGVDNCNFESTSAILGDIDAQQIFVDDAAHYPHIDQPIVIAESIDALIQQIDSNTAAN
jgi:pimeloyl-ACP methyl ester carboxylesterase